MQIQKFTNKQLQTHIELIAEDTEETELLRELFQGVNGNRYTTHSFGYNRKMPKYSARRPEATWTKILEENAKKQVLTFKLLEK